MGSASQIGCGPTCSISPTNVVANGWSIVAVSGIISAKTFASDNVYGSGGHWVAVALNVFYWDHQPEHANTIIGYAIYSAWGFNGEVSCKVFLKCEDADVQM